MDDKDEGLELKRLIELQDIEARIKELSRQVEEAPLEVDRLDLELEEDHNVVTSASEAIGDSSKRRKRLEGEVEDLRAKLSHFKDRLMEVKTNTEYQAMLHEISYVEKQIEGKEDQILEQMIESDELNQRLRQAEKDLKVRESEITERKKELERLMSVSASQLEDLHQSLMQLKNEISDSVLDRYQRIADARNGMAMAAVVNRSCAGCHVRLRPQLLAEIRTGRRLILCENCSRILYYQAS
jgi:predicted  nucleic acid-binding Zn-ribbon protein